MVYSHSKITLFTQCERKYAYKYVEKIPTPAEENLSLILGNSVHYILEVLYKRVQHFSVPTKAELFTEFSQYRNEQLQKLTDETKIRMNEGQQLSLYENMGHEYISRYYETYAPFDTTLVMATEEKIFPKLSDDITFAGQVDRIDVDNDVFTIVDYKTNRSYPRDTNDAYKDQLNLYGLGILQTYGSKCKTIQAKLIYVHLRNEVRREITNAELEATKEKYTAIVAQITTKTQQRRSGNKDAFAAKECFLCSSCAFRTICPLFAHSYADDEQISLDTMKSATVKGLIDRLAHLSYQLRAIEEEKDYLAKLLGQYGLDHDFSKLYGFQNKVTIGKTETFSPNKEHRQALKDKLQTDGLLDEVVDIDRYKLARKIKEGVISLDEYDTLITKSLSVTAQRASALKEKEQEEYEEKVGE